MQSTSGAALRSTRRERAAQLPSHQDHGDSIAAAASTSRIGGGPALSGGPSLAHLFLPSTRLDSPVSQSFRKLDVIFPASGAGAPPLASSGRTFSALPFVHGPASWRVLAPHSHAESLAFLTTAPSRCLLSMKRGQDSLGAVLASASSPLAHLAIPLLPIIALCHTWFTQPDPRRRSFACSILEPSGRWSLGWTVP